MSTSIDLHEFRERLVRSATDEQIEAIAKCGSPAMVFLIEVGGEHVPPEITERLKELGYDDEDSVWVRVNS